jgi:pimeloyl-ACP methyl ester carboxylesterase
MKRMIAVALLAAFFTPTTLTIPAAAAAEAPATMGFSVTVTGKGPDVILIPGLASSRTVWNDTAARLTATHRLHLVQLAGFAGEPAAMNADGEVLASVTEAIAAYVKDQHLKKPAIIGHSLGGEIGLMLAARHPESVGKLLVVDSLPFYSLLIDPNATAETMRPRAQKFHDAMLAATPEQTAAMQEASINGLVKTVAARPPRLDDSRRSDPKTVAAAVRDVMSTDLRPELGRITAPLTILYAWDPMMGPPAPIDQLFTGAYAKAPAARLVRVDNSLHFIMVDQPAVFAKAVDSFLAP